MNQCWAVWTRGAEFGCGAVKVWYQRGERSVGRHPSATGRGDMAMLSGVWLWGQERGMLRGETSWTIGRYRQVCMLMVVIGMKGFPWTMIEMKKISSRLTQID